MNKQICYLGDLYNMYRMNKKRTALKGIKTIYTDCTGSIQNIQYTYKSNYLP